MDGAELEATALRSETPGLPSVDAGADQAQSGLGEGAAAPSGDAVDAEARGGLGDGDGLPGASAPNAAAASGGAASVTNGFILHPNQQLGNTQFK